MNTIRALVAGACTMGLFVMWGVNALVHHDQVLSAAFALFALLGCGRMIQMALKVEANDRELAKLREARVREMGLHPKVAEEIVAMVRE